jgi:putative oxidoreductase
MFEQLLVTNVSELMPFALRLAVGLVILPHGLQKLAGWFGGFGFKGTMNFFTETMGLPWLVGFLVIVIESFGALALILGFATRLAALGLIAVMAGAIITTHLPVGFFMNWFGNQEGEGFEFHLLVIAMALVLLLSGGGVWSADSYFSTLLVS